ncbi:hypothetical protein HBH64_228310 [Parastagonospora nodorum]|nr:hypothetical protein HBI01_022130 [Parastagonospora nodorum]KAH4315736.1 hypothetical protein HBI02_058020 [Parastagonospora nodorum]KAH4320275.1 hypothetical protein HBI00_229320 [Parastagonospora nodorum]KAH4386853.1 hypothetical protein HBH94_046530 [Parastagonospora nodorum]KAH4439639.1 hypothetical protein HBH90_236080 [Parastagonospora nodorum]
MKTRVARLWTEQLLFGPVSRGLGTRPATPFLRSFFTATHAGARPKAVQSTLRQTGLLYWRYQRSALGRRFRSWRVKKDLPPPQRPDPTPHLGSPEPALSLSQRLKALSREYGWTAVGVYFGLSLLDFPFCFLAVRLLGTDRIGHYEDVIKNAFWSVVRMAFPDAGKKAQDAIPEDVAEATAREGNIGAAEVAIRSGADASIWTQLGLAYIVHKSFVFVRVPLTAAVLPKVVKTLRSWGYNIGKKKPKKT